MFKRNLARSVSSRKIYSFILSCFKLTFKYFAIPQTANGPLFDHIPRPVSHTSGLESKVQSSTKNCSFECKSLLETGDRNLTKSDVEELLKHFTAKVKNEQKLEPDVTTSQDTIEQKTICSLLNDESNGTSLGSNKHSLVVGKEEKSCIQVVKEVQISVRKFDNMDSSDAEDDADSSEECDEGDALHLDDKAENYNDSKEGKCDDNSGKNTTSKAHRSKKETAKCCQLLPTPTEIKELINGMQKDDYKYTFRWHLLTGGKVCEYWIRDLYLKYVK